jgi:hypothetical protein
MWSAMQSDPTEWPLIRPPFRMIIGGGSGTGKTQLVQVMLNEMKDVFGLEFPVIKYCQSAPDEKYYEMAAALPQLELCDEITEDYISNPGAYKSVGEHSLVIIDDLAPIATKSKVVYNLFAVNSRHWNISVILITQNIYIKSSFMHDLSLNSTHLIITENKRQPGQVRILAQQLEPQLWRGLMAAYYQAMKLQKYGYLVIDLDKLTPEKYKYFTGISRKTPRYYFKIKAA